MARYETAVNAEYDPRAQTYDEARGGWHRDLAEDFVRWIEPRQGDTVLDLGCGTGLVTFQMARAVTGPNGEQEATIHAQDNHAGKVIGIDLNRAMLDVAEDKFESLFESERRMRSSITFRQGNVADASVLDSIIDDVLSSSPSWIAKRNSAVCSNSNRQIFDIISCCSAFVLMPDRESTLQLWRRYLKPGGRIIVDIPSEDRSMYVLMNDVLRPQFGLEWNWGWHEWVKSQADVEALFTKSGFEIVRVVRTHSYFRETKYEDSDEAAMEFFESQDKLKTALAEKGKLEEARKVWPDLFRTAKKDDDGKLTDGHSLYIVIARNPRT